MSLPLSRRGFCTGLAALPLARPAFAGPAELAAMPASVQLAPEGYPATGVWSYGGSVPGPLIRAPQGTRMARRLENRLDVPTSVHWHGLRIDNAMDGVAGLTQDAVPPGGSFDYAFALPDAGTYWYHAHANSMEQVARGLSGALVVDEPSPPDIDRDELLMIDDWLIDPETGQLADGFASPMARSHGGRLGNLAGVNGRWDFALEAKQHERLRLRLVNAANARIFVLRLDGLAGWTVALDGMPLETPEPVTAEIVLAPAQRADLIVDVTAQDGVPAGLLMQAGQDGWKTLAGVRVTGRLAARPREAPAPLPPNPRMDRPVLDGVRSLAMPLQGGAMRGLESARFEGAELDVGALAARGQYWALAGQAGPGADPFARLSLDEAVRLRFGNATVFPHAMHLHGMHFRVVARDGSQGPMRDTVLVLPGESTEIALVADNPGKWLLHCHMLGHAASGMTTWIEVA
ncbi:multicopper oxidase family protein [Poseidonocella sp. HB161398]|uniref:multicopper oxidase family protein n=1 Tax=Poseidonocella sp. HB161398 TaxID=2320855 RepID=UPI00110927A9|nr:multicopper oxidase family protein [Poseidonocella sp. HB161398]